MLGNRNGGRRLTNSCSAVCCLKVYFQAPITQLRHSVQHPASIGATCLPPSTKRTFLIPPRQNFSLWPQTLNGQLTAPVLLLLFRVQLCVMARAKTLPKRTRGENENLDDNSNTNNNNTTNTCSNKRAKKHHQQPHQNVQHAVLTQYYAKIQTLRDWVLLKLPKSSKIRRRKLASVGLDASSAGKDAWSDEETALGQLLDTTLVAIRHDDNNTTKQAEDLDLRWEQWIAFSQGGTGDESYVTLSDGGQRGSVDLQSEMIDYVIWLLFSRESSRPGSWPKHMLCDGFRKNSGSRPPPQQRGLGLGSGITRRIPGVFLVHPNHCVKGLKEAPWPQLLALLGKAGQRIMLDLLLDCAVFVAVKAGKGNFNQLSGIQISELDTLTAVAAAGQKDSLAGAKRKTVELRPSEITFVRSRMLYARAALNARGLVHFGLRHIRTFLTFLLLQWACD